MAFRVVMALSLLAVIVALSALDTGLTSCATCHRATTREVQPPTGSLLVDMPGGGKLVVERERIPKALQAGCHVCPGWCTQVDLRPLPAGMLVPWYRRLARNWAHGDTSHPDDETWEQIERLGCIVAGSDAVVQRAFLELLDDDDEAVRYVTAAECLERGLTMERAREALREIASGEGPFALDAQIRLIDDAAGIHDGI